MLHGDLDKLRSRLASLLLKGHGEHLFPLGAHPPPSALFGSSSTAPIDNPVGQPLTASELNTALDRLKQACTALRAELNELYRVENEGKIYGCWQARLHPAGVEEIMEVRVAVVGNVDAGKSTTLGVLTRGGLDDGRGKVRGEKVSLEVHSDLLLRPELRSFDILTRSKLVVRVVWEERY